MYVFILVRCWLTVTYSCMPHSWNHSLTHPILLHSHCRVVGYFSREDPCLKRWKIWNLVLYAAFIAVSNIKCTTTGPLTKCSGHINQISQLHFTLAFLQQQFSIYIQICNYQNSFISFSALQNSNPPFPTSQQTPINATKQPNIFQNTPAFYFLNGH